VSFAGFGFNLGEIALDEAVFVFKNTVQIEFTIISPTFSAFREIFSRSILILALI